MFELVRIRKEHLDSMRDQPSNSYLRTWTDRYIAAVMENKSSYAALVNGKVALCGGVVELWQDRGFIWTVFNEEFSGHKFLPVFRGIKRFLDDYPCSRLELAIPYSFEQGARRAHMLGFECEVLQAKKFLPNGTDCMIWVRIK